MERQVVEPAAMKTIIKGAEGVDGDNCTLFFWTYAIPMQLSLLNFQFLHRLLERAAYARHLAGVRLRNNNVF